MDAEIMSVNANQRRLRLGVIGGGPGSFIGSIHRGGAVMDGLYEVVAGAFSSNAERAIEAAEALHVPRGYPSGHALITAEAERNDRCDVIAIMTPNDSHFALAQQALRSGFHVFCEKPLTHTSAEADELAQLAKAQNRLFCVAYAYSGFPMVRQARAMVANGDLGELRQVQVEYTQGHLATLTPQERTGDNWHFQPEVSGPSLILGDIGTHAENLAEYVTGLKISELAADLTAFVEGRELDDDGNMLLRFEGGAKGVLHASQISVGEENNLALYVYGDKGGLEWHQNEPNTLVVKWLEDPVQIYRTSNGYLCEAAAGASRTPPSHPEGYLEAFANLYTAFANHVRAVADGVEPEAAALDYPKIDDGVRGMAFVNAVVESSKNNAAWTSLPL
jgi:predicted dehydrogenase